MCSYGHTLETVDEAKYLGVGVTLTKDLDWGKHVDNITKKANMSLAFLKMNIIVSSPTIKGVVYNAMVRPLVEYGVGRIHSGQDPPDRDGPTQSSQMDIPSLSTYNQHPTPAR